MNIKDYLKSQIQLGKKPDLALIYEELMNLGYSSIDIYHGINEIILSNIEKALDDWNKKKENKE